MTEKVTRVLGAARLSRTDDASTSMERQDEHLVHYCSAPGRVLVDTARDAGVSGAVAPFLRPQLGPWLTDERAKQYDVIAAYRLDRIGRSLKDLVDLVDWLHARGKHLVSITEGFDSSTAVGRMVIFILGMVAEMELEAIRERNRDSHKHARDQGKFHGGAARPYWTVPVKAPDGQGHRLTLDEKRSGDIRKAIRLVMGGSTVQGAAEALGMSRTTLSRILSDRSLLGERIHDGRTVRGKDGRPVLWCPPLIKPDEFKALQDRLTRRPRRHVGTEYLLSTLVTCECNTPLRAHTERGGKYRYYRCRTPGCTSWPATDLEQVVMRWVMRRIGDVEMTVIEEPPDTSVELEDVNRSIEELREDRAAGLFRSEADQVVYRSQMAILLDRREALEATSTEPVEVGTGQTYGDHFRSLETVAEQRTFLADLGLTITVKGKLVHIKFPERLEERAGRLIAAPA